MRQHKTFYTLTHKIEVAGDLLKQNEGKMDFGN